MDGVVMLFVHILVMVLVFALLYWRSFAGCCRSRRRAS
jgi:hypothetical protein